MLPGLLAVLGAAATYLGSVAAAFAMLMRLSLRLLAERGSRSSRLGAYLDDPFSSSCRCAPCSAPCTWPSRCFL